MRRPVPVQTEEVAGGHYATSAQPRHATADLIASTLLLTVATVPTHGLLPSEQTARLRRASFSLRVRSAPQNQKRLLENRSRQ